MLDRKISIMNLVNIVRSVCLCIMTYTQVTNAISPGGNNVCSYECKQSYYISVKIDNDCGFGGWSRCAGSKAQQAYRMSTCYKCCDGWTSEGDSKHCDIAKCHNLESGKCLNKGTCIRPDECNCPSGTKLPKCEDINECSTDNGGCTDICVNIIGSFSCRCDDHKGLLLDKKSCAYLCYGEPAGTCANGGICVGKDKCDCPEGTEPPACEDVDECKSDKNTCEDKCVNEPASFRCTCPDGYGLAEDLRSCSAICYGHPAGFCQHSQDCVKPNQCVCSTGYELPECGDKDECLNAKSHACRQVCINEVGSYSCACEAGYVLSEDDISCDDVNECLTNNSDCDHVCENIPGSFTCSCDTGYELATDNRTCIDVDECSTSEHTCESKCENTVGTYKCSCAEGLGWDTNEHTCKPVCFGEEPGMCPNQGSCVSPGVCDCKTGYAQPNCSDIDECATDKGGCDHLCENEEGSFFCSCFDGFTLIVDTNTCEDVNECEINKTICELDCLNLHGSYECTCEDGFGWDNRTMSCKPVCFDERPGDCKNGGTCTSPGTCSCLEGYMLPRCNDIDECSGNVSVCTLTCHNLPGTYRCDCEEGYSWMAVPLSCKAKCGGLEPGVCPNGGLCTSPGVCTCADGFEGNECTDIDECSKGIAGCSPESCENLPGSFLCKCDEGFLWNPAHASCLADCGGDESGMCANGGTCTSRGVCACAQGFAPPNCTDEDECSGNHGCSRGCVNVNGSYFCEGGKNGYGIIPGQHTERPVCFGGIPGTCPNGGACVQPDLCNCDSGYTPSHCSDLDECAEGNFDCNGECVNVDGSYYCSTQEGYGRLPGETVDRPVCFGFLPGQCPNGGVCASPGICTCEAGFKTPQCTDKNECFENAGGCDTDCVNIPGAYFCDCWSGYGKQPGEEKCKPVCRNSIPGECPNGGKCTSPSVCDCAPGYDPPDCRDINECIENNGDCELKCLNEPGTHSCECRTGFGWVRAEKTCRPVCYGLPPGTCLNDGVCTAPDTCSCPPKFQTDNCADVNECAQTDHGCEFGCVNQFSGYFCKSENEGYGKLPGSEKDVPICFGQPLGTCANGGTCVEPGVCTCPPGYEKENCADVDECESVSCEHSCKNKPGSYYCYQPPGHGKGPNDEIFKPLCGENLPGHCENGGTCVSPGTCICKPGFQLPLCQDINECAGPNNGGCGSNRCENTAGSYRCVCAEGYGWNEVQQLCLPVCYNLSPGTCNNNGTCVDKDQCLCPVGYKEPDCSEINECKEMIVECPDTCVNLVGSYYCSSATPGYGRNPGESVDKPVCFGQAPGKCLNGGTCVAPGSCTCPVGYETSDCTDVDECSTDNGGCRYGCTNTDGSYICDCGEGYVWEDIHHACIATCYGEEPGKCANNGTCMRPWICNCRQGFEMPACSDIDECAVNNGGCGDQTCHNELGSHYCDCEQDYQWESREKKCKPVCLDLPPGRCPNRGSCTAPGVCSCPSGYSTPACEDIDECADNNGQCAVECVNIAGAYYCKTSDGHGSLPGETDALPLCFTLPPGNCPNDGTCISPESCECKHGYKPPICDDYDECEQEGICELDCHNTDGSYYCDCQHGYAWDSFSMECKPSCFDMPEGQCPNGGSCLRPGVCVCESGYKTPDCSDIDECTAGIDTCELSCNNVIGSYTCTCHTGYSWDKESMSCLPTCYGSVGTCPNGGKCKSPDMCSCPAGFERPKCSDINECAAAKPVCASGQCTNLEGSYKCGCEAGYGWSVETDSCQPICHSNSPGSCPNAGTCISPDVCSCLNGYDSSKACEDIDECSSNNGDCEKECVNLPGSYYCVCREGYGKSFTDTECKPLCYGEIPGVCPNGGDCQTPDSCTCSPGYAVPDCSDENECETNNGGCDRTCHNVNGSYYCECEDEHSWNVELGSCQPVCFGLRAGECKNGGTCTQPDVCSCPPGYDPPTCSDINECDSGTHDCTGECVDVKGTYYCLSEKPGYGRLPGDDKDKPICQGLLPGSCSNGGFCYAPNVCHCAEGFHNENGNCIDVDECAASSPCTGSCLNLKGTYRCSCDKGFTWDNEQHTCLPVCDGHKPGGCQNDGQCTSPGVCQCSKGFQIPDCSDIDECETEEGNVCESGCRNGNGFFYCSSNRPGYGRLPGETTDRAMCDSSLPPGSCENGGTCVRPGTCQCPKGFTPPLCADVNECEEDIDGCDGCENFAGGFTCGCQPGYQWSSDHLTCKAICYNFTAGTCGTEGTCVEPYQCSCHVGFILPKCDDDDECSRAKGGCSQFCENTVGSFVCSCDEGYSIAEDKTSCIDADECEVDNAGCTQMCTNTPGTFECGCFKGYEKLKTGDVCIDVDECEDNSGGCAEKCINTLGSYYCACFEGKGLNSNGLCLPICYDFPVGTCGDNGICSAPGQCDCDTGYELPHCTDINECEGNSGRGDCQQICENTEGSFTCQCLRGYQMTDKQSCEDVDECNRWPFPCDHFCENTLGTFRCSCEDGHHLGTDRSSCLKEDPCSINNGECPSSLRCMNTVNGITCDCLEGFARSDLGFCEDFDECTINNGACSQICVNTVGGHYCKCRNKFELLEDQRSCQWCDDTGSNINCWSLCEGNGDQCDCPGGRVLHEDGKHCVASCPCHNGGYCKTLFPDYECVCEGTGYRGVTCDDPAVDIPSEIRLRSFTEPQLIRVVARPNQSITISAMPVREVSLSPDSVTIQAPATEGYFNIYTEKTGIYEMFFSLTGPDAHLYPQSIKTTVFAGDMLVREQLLDDELPEGCFRLDVTVSLPGQEDSGSKKHKLTFLSTAPWYKVLGMEWVNFSFGSVVLKKAGHGEVPLFFTGLELVVERQKLILGPVSLFRKKHIELKAGFPTNPQCKELEVLPEDLSLLNQMNNLYKSLLKYVNSRLPSWLNLLPTEGSMSYVGLFYPTLLPGYLVKDIEACSELPVMSTGLYYTVRFTDPFSLQLFENTVTLPQSAESEEYCLVFSQPADKQDLFAIAFPSSSHKALKQLDILQAVKQGTGLDINWKALALSLSTKLPVSTPTSTQLWNGGQMFLHESGETSLWISVDVSENSGDSIHLSSSLQAYLSVPNVEQTLSYFLGKYSDTSLTLEDNLKVMLKMEIFAKEEVLNLIANVKTTALLSTGFRGKPTRRTCGEGSNPEGVFLQVLTNGILLETSAVVGNLTFLDTDPTYFSLRSFSENSTMSFSDYQGFLETLFAINDVSEKTITCLHSQVIPRLNKHNSGLMARASSLRKGLSDVKWKSNSLYLKNVTSTLVDFLTLSEELTDSISQAQANTRYLKQQLILAFQPIGQEMQFFEGNLTMLSSLAADFTKEVVTYSSTALIQLSEWAIKSMSKITILGQELKINGTFRYRKAGLIDHCEMRNLEYNLQEVPDAMLSGVIVETDQSKLTDSWLNTIWNEIEIVKGLQVKIALSGYRHEYYLELDARLSSLGSSAPAKLIIDHNGVLLEAIGMLLDSFPVSLSGSALIKPPPNNTLWSLPVTGKFVTGKNDNSFGKKVQEALRETLWEVLNSFAERVDLSQQMLNRAVTAYENGLVEKGLSQQAVHPVEVLVQFTEETPVVEDNIKDLKEYLKKNFEFESVCEHSTCNLNCVEGGHLEWCTVTDYDLMYPCLSKDMCQYQSADLACITQNLACSAVLEVAFSKKNLSEGEALIGKLQTLMDNSTLVKLERELNKFRLHRAELKHQQSSYMEEQYKQYQISAARNIETLKKIQFSVRGEVDFRDCGFELSIGDRILQSIDVHCMMTALWLGEKMVKVTFDLGNTESIVWQIAQSVVRQLGEHLSNIQGNMTENYSLDTDHLLKIKDALQNESLHVDTAENFGELQCTTFSQVKKLIEMTLELLSKVTDLMSSDDTFEMVQPFPASIPVSRTGMNLTAAWVRYGIAETEMEQILSSIQPASNLVLQKAQQIHQFDKKMAMTADMFIQNVPLISLWHSKMDSFVYQQFNFTMCAGLVDCIKWGLFNLKQMTKHIDFQKSSQILNAISSFEKTYFDMLKLNSLIDIKESLKQLQDLFSRFSLENFVCSTLTANNRAQILVVQHGSDAELECPMNIDHTATIIWIRDSKNLISIGEDKMLTIGNVTLKDEGEYTCRVWRLNGYQTSPAVELSVRYPVTLLSDLPWEHQAVEGETVHLDCPSVGRPPVKTVWRTNSGLSQITGSVLHMENVKASATGLYVCDITNADGQVRSSELFLSVRKVRAACPLVRYRFSFISGPKVMKDKNKLAHKVGSTIEDEFTRALRAVFHDKTNTFYLDDVVIFKDRWQGEFSVHSINCQTSGNCNRGDCQQNYMTEFQRLHKFLTVFQAIRGSVFLFEKNQKYYYFNSAYFDVITDEPICPDKHGKIDKFICVSDDAQLYPVGPPVNLTIAPNHLQWNPPVSGADFVKGYRVIIFDRHDNMKVLVNETTAELIYSVPFDLTDDRYEVSVEGFTERHTGEAAKATGQPQQKETSVVLYAVIFSLLGLLCGAIATSAVYCFYKKKHSKRVAPSPSVSTAQLIGPDMPKNTPSGWNAIENDRWAYKNMTVGNSVMCDQGTQSPN